MLFPAGQAAPDRLLLPAIRRRSAAGGAALRQGNARRLAWPCLQDDLHCIPPVDQLLVLEGCQHGAHKLERHAQPAALIGCRREGH